MRWRITLRDRDVVWMPVVTLVFPNAFFDRVVGFGLLHHADPVASVRKFAALSNRVGGRCFANLSGQFETPEFARRCLPHRSKHHSENEHPLRYDAFCAWARVFT